MKYHEGALLVLFLVCLTSISQLFFYQIPNNSNCITFSVSQGTGCAWMCNYCATQLGTNNYYFIDNVCTYQQGIGCVGNPFAGVQYTCCRVTDYNMIGVD